MRCRGATVSCLGHSDGRLKQAIADRLRKIPFAHTGYFIDEAVERLAEKLAQRAPGARVSSATPSARSRPAAAPTSPCRPPPTGRSGTFSPADPNPLYGASKRSSKAITSRKPINSLKSANG